MTIRRFLRFAAIFLSFFGGIALLVYLLLKQDPAAVVQSVRSFGLISFLGFLSISTTNFILYAFRWQLIINRLLPKGDRVGLYKVFMHRMTGFAMSYLTPAAQVGGEPVRIAMLSSEKNVTVKQATSSVLLDIAFELCAYVLFILAGVVLAILTGLGSASSIAVIVVGLGSLALFLLLFFYFLAKGHGFFGPLFRFFRLDRIKRLKPFEQGILDTENMMSEFLAKNPRLVVVVALLSAGVISFRVVEVFYIAKFFGVNFTFAQAFLASTLPGIALLLPVPAGVGVFEGGFAAVFALVGVALNPVAFALIIRGRDLVFICVGLIHLVQKGSSFLKRKIIDPLIA